MFALAITSFFFISNLLKIQKYNLAMLEVCQFYICKAGRRHNPSPLEGCYSSARARMVLSLQHWRFPDIAIWHEYQICVHSKTYSFFFSDVTELKDVIGWWWWVFLFSLTSTAIILSRACWMLGIKDNRIEGFLEHWTDGKVNCHPLNNNKMRYCWDMMNYDACYHLHCHLNQCNDKWSFAKEWLTWWGWRSTSVELHKINVHKKGRKN